MNELFPEANRGNDVRRLNLLWHCMLPGAIVVTVLAVYAWTRTEAYVVPIAMESIAPYLPAILGAVLLSGTGLAMFLKSRLPDMVARNSAAQPMQRVNVAMFTLLGAADMPAVVGIGIFPLAPSDWLALAIVFYAFAAGMMFKPDFDALLAIERRPGGK